MSLTEVTCCEICDNGDLWPVMDLGDLPLPDDLVPFYDNRTTEKYPTQILFCDRCKTAFSRWKVPNKTVFPQEYHYRAANTKDVLAGMAGLVENIEIDYGRPVRDLKVLDIGCNDGSLLDEFKKRGAITTGIEPTGAAEEAAAKGHGIDHVYLDLPEAYRYVKTYGVPDYITFVNVFAHIEDTDTMLNSIQVIRGVMTNPDLIPMRPTRIVIENHYLGSVVETKQFDTFYHEHPRTYSYTSFAYIAARLGMHIERVEFPKRYGGNIRITLAPGPGAPNLRLLVEERGLLDGLKNLSCQVTEWKHRKREQLTALGPMPCAAMPGRAAVLFNLLGFDVDQLGPVYESPRSIKIGHYVPGTRIPIDSDENFPWKTYRGPVLNMAWHIKDEIEANWRAKGFRGYFVQAIDKDDFPLTGL
jgi:2-polyprenyl-3-methyl-5-hydroxy-6-metoxy-1,4-benzoquinol methylase